AGPRRAPPPPRARSRRRGGTAAADARGGPGRTAPTAARPRRARSAVPAPRGAWWPAVSAPCASDTRIGPGQALVDGVDLELAGVVGPVAGVDLDPHAVGGAPEQLVPPLPGPLRRGVRLVGQVGAEALHHRDLRGDQARQVAGP